MAGLGKDQRMFQRFSVANFTYHHHVRRLAHGADQCNSIRCGVSADFALVYDGFVMLEQVLDRILNGQDVSALGVVAVFKHGSQRGGLA